MQGAVSDRLISQLFQSLVALYLATAASSIECRALQGISTRCLTDVCKMFRWPVICGAGSLLKVLWNCFSDTPHFPVKHHDKRRPHP